MSTSNKRQSNQSLSSSYGSIQAESASPRPIFRTGSKTNTSNILSATTITQNNDTSGPHSPSSLTSGHPLLNNNSNNDDDEIEDITDIKPEDELNDYHLDLLNYKSITLENKGSVARDHMANERTFLAWLRTSLAFITLGIGITQLFRLEKPNSKIQTSSTVIPLSRTPHNGENSQIITRFGKPLGSVFIVLGMLTLLFGMKRYFQVQYFLTKDYYPATRLSIFVLISIILAIVVVTFGLVLKTSL